jgi:hypothetical protein
VADERHTIEQTEAGDPPRPPEIERCIRISFPQGFLVALLAGSRRQAVPAPVSAGEVTTAVDRLDRTTRHELPQIRHIFIEAQSLGEAGTRQSVDGA